MESDIIVQKILAKTGLTNEEFQKKILEKQQELSGLISKDGATYIIAKELGLDLFEKTKRRLEIKNIVPYIKNLNLSARIFKIFEPREFEREGEKSQVANVILADGSGTIRLSLWDNQTEMLKKIHPGLAVEIFGAYTKQDNRGNTEIRLSKRGGIKIIEDSDIPTLDKMPKPTIQRSNIMDLEENGTYEVRGAVVQLFETNLFFEVCPQCNTRIKEEKNEFKCKTHGVVQPNYMIVLAGVIDDGTGNIRAVFFRDAALQLIGMNIEKALEDRENLFEKVDILGKEFVFVGKVRLNRMFDRLEFVVSEVRDVDIKSEANKILNILASKD